jgi:hypothetical protein
LKLRGSASCSGSLVQKWYGHNHSNIAVVILVTKFLQAPADENSKERAMQDEEHFLCSQLVKVSGRHGAEIGNLEEISATHCTLVLEHGLPVGTPVKMQCLEGSTGQGANTESVIRGHVECSRRDPEQGYLLEVEFEKRPWNEKKWKPAHMLPLNPKKDSAQLPLMLD